MSGELQFEKQAHWLKFVAKIGCRRGVHLQKHASPRRTRAKLRFPRPSRSRVVRIPTETRRCAATSDAPTPISGCEWRDEAGEGA